jgi:DNA repair protein RadC
MMEQAQLFTTTHKTWQVTDLPESERPVNRICEAGVKAVSKIELLAGILQTPNAYEPALELFRRFGDMQGIARATVYELMQIKGIGKAAAARIKAAAEFGERIYNDVSEKYQILSPAYAARLLFTTIGHATQEKFVIIYLDTRNGVIDTEVLYTGTLNSSLVRIGEVFRGAIVRNCLSIMVSHNHPSGNPEPSPEDIALTRKLVQAGMVLQIEVLDHIIIGSGSNYVSLRERGAGFEG